MINANNKLSSFNDTIETIQIVANVFYINNKII